MNLYVLIFCFLIGIALAAVALKQNSKKRVSDNFFHRYPLNTPGRYYINNQCTDCDLCRESAPNNIKRDDRTGYSYVFKQPESPEEITAVEAGVAGCPTEGVSNDGNLFDWGTTPIFDWNASYEKQGHPEVRFEIEAPIRKK